MKNGVRPHLISYGNYEIGGSLTPNYFPFSRWREKVLTERMRVDQ